MEHNDNDCYNFLLSCFVPYAMTYFRKHEVTKRLNHYFFHRFSITLSYFTIGTLFKITNGSLRAAAKKVRFLLKLY